MRIGYARTSTLEQEAGLEAQIRILNENTCEKIFSEQTSSIAVREQLETTLEFMREGDVLVVTNIDRLARSVSHLGDIIRGVRKKKAHLQILNLGIDTSTATGELVLNLLGSVAQFERAMMLERQKEGISKAKAEGKYKGRTPTAMKQADTVVKLFNEGIGPSAISKQLNIGRSSVYRALASQTAV